MPTVAQFPCISGCFGNALERHIQQFAVFLNIYPQLLITLYSTYLHALSLLFFWAFNS